MVHHIFTQKFWHQLFEAGVFLKALNSVWETGAGIFLLFSTHPMLRDRFIFLSQEEFLGGRHEHIFRFASEHLNQLSVSTKNFVGLYLLFHGLLNMFLAYNLYKNRLWAYPVTIAITCLFLVYQLYRLAHTQSLILLCVTAFDIFFIVLTWHEYRHQQKKQHHDIIPS
ncbi:MAG: DUF2127 domain-containing protein [Candidatus Adlerbacteria bacterium]